MGRDWENVLRVKTLTLSSPQVDPPYYSFRLRYHNPPPHSKAVFGFPTLLCLTSKTNRIKLHDKHLPSSYSAVPDTIILLRHTSQHYCSKFPVALPPLFKTRLLCVGHQHYEQLLSLSVMTTLCPSFAANIHENTFSSTRYCLSLDVELLSGSLKENLSISSTFHFDLDAQTFIF